MNRLAAYRAGFAQGYFEKSGGDTALSLGREMGIYGGGGKPVPKPVKKPVAGPKPYKPVGDPKYPAAGVDQETFNRWYNRLSAADRAKYQTTINSNPNFKRLYDNRK